MIIGPQNEYGRGRLNSYTAASKTGRHTLTITLEYDDASSMGFDVAGLDEIVAKDKAAAQADRRRPKRLALPAPDREV